ncbi:cellulose biosynthesis protein BcsS [Methylobacterium oryzae CBMB20]
MPRPEIAREMLVAGPQLDVRPTRLGLRLHGEVWARPTEATLLQASAVAGSARDSLWARLAWGYRLWETYLGPEAALYADGTGYAKWSLGLHGTDFVPRGIQLPGLGRPPVRDRPGPGLSLRDPVGLVPSLIGRPAGPRGRRGRRPRRGGSRRGACRPSPRKRPVTAWPSADCPPAGPRSR